MTKHIQLSQLLLSKINESGEIDSDTLDGLVEDILPIFKKYGFTFQSSECITLGMDKFSIQECAKCSKLFSNRDLNPAGLDQDYVFESVVYAICDGGTYNEQNLCEECLPLTHRWGHSS